MTKELLGGLELNRIYQRDCLSDGGMALIPDKSIDMILCDLPYGTTDCKWDTTLPFEQLWDQYRRIIKDNGAIVLTSSQPFTSALVMSNPKMFKYALVWDKVAVSNGFFAKIMPMKIHEDINVFYKKKPTYNPQMVEGKQWHRGGKRGRPNFTEGKDINWKAESDKSKLKYPKSIITFSNADRSNIFHPTQKPVELFEWLIKTYTNECDIVLDNCMGSGTTAISALNTNRRFIGFETEPAYIEIANKRIEGLLN